jgi:hypothetical protein
LPGTVTLKQNADAGYAGLFAAINSTPVNADRDSLTGYADCGPDIVCTSEMVMNSVGDTGATPMSH